MKTIVEHISGTWSGDDYLYLYPYLYVYVCTNLFTRRGSNSMFIFVCVDKLERHKVKTIVEHLSELDQVMSYIYLYIYRSIHLYIYTNLQTRSTRWCSNV